MVEKAKRNSKLLCYVFLTVISIQYSLVNTELEITGGISTILMVLNIIIFLSWLVSRKYKYKTLALMLALISIAVITYTTSGETVFMIMLMSAIMFSVLDYKRTYHYLFVLRFIFLMAVILVSVVGLLNVRGISIIKGGTTTAVVGYGLGFNHPNQLAYAIGFLIILFVCYKNEDIRIKHLVAIAFASVMGYWVTKSRTLLFISVVLIVLVFLCRNRTENRYFTKMLDTFAVWFMPFCALLALGLPLMMSKVSGRAKVILYSINGVMGSRFTHSARVFENYSPSLFGGIINFEKLQTLYGYSVVDNGYLRLLYNFGILGFAIFMVLYFITIKKLIEKKEYIYVAAIMVISLLGISENILKSFAINFTVAFWSELLRSNSFVLISKKRNLFKIRVKGR